MQRKGFKASLLERIRIQEVFKWCGSGSRRSSNGADPDPGGLQMVWIRIQEVFKWCGSGSRRSSNGVDPDPYTWLHVSWLEDDFEGDRKRRDSIHSLFAWTDLDPGGLQMVWIWILTPGYMFLGLRMTLKGTGRDVIPSTASSLGRSPTTSGSTLKRCTKP